MDELNTGFYQQKVDQGKLNAVRSEVQLTLGALASAFVRARTLVPNRLN